MIRLRELNQIAANEVDGAALAEERKRWPVDILGGQRRGVIDAETRAVVQDEIGFVVDETPQKGIGSNPDGSSPGALQGNDYPLTYDADGYVELPACLDTRKPQLGRKEGCLAWGVQQP